MPFLPKAGPSGLPGNPSDAPIPPIPDAKAWQKDMQAAFRTLEPLLRHLKLDPARAPDRLLSDPAFPLLVTRSFADRMVAGDWNDPLLRQVLPVGAEDAPAAGFLDDAVGDLDSQVVPGLLHKYASRALMMISPNCAIHCRYCFRREFPYGDLPRGKAGWEEAWAYLETAEGVDEIIFSGGDPLFLEDRRLARILERTLGLPSIRTVRFHTRLPVVLPSRVDAGLVGLLGDLATAKALVVVIHANHPAEISGDCPPALEALRGTGALLLNQAVLLKGINDHADILAELSRRLLQNGVLPYYLHQLDRVNGAAHFETDQDHGLALMEDLRGKLPGYAVPRYVREVAGEAYKRPLAP